MSLHGVRPLYQVVTGDEFLSLLGDIRDILRDILSATIEPEEIEYDAPRWMVRGVTVSTSGTPVRGPDVPIPKGFTVAVEMRVPSSGTPVGYVAPGQNEVAASDSRKEIRPGGAFSINIRNMKDLWFDADTDGVSFEIIAEQRPG